MLMLWKALGAPGRLRFLIAALLCVIASVSGVILLGLSGWFLVAGALAGAAGLGHSFNHLYPSAGVRGAAFARVLGRYGEQLSGHDAILSLSAKLRPRIFHAGAHARRGLSPLPAADLSALTDDMDAAEGAFLKVILPTIGVISGCLVALAYALASDLVLFVLAALTMALTIGALPFLSVQTARRKAAELASEADAARAGIARLAENATELDVYGVLSRYASEAHAQLLTWQARAERLEQPFRGLSALLSAAGVSLAALALWRIPATGGSLPLAAGAGLALIAAFEAASAMLKVLEAAPRAATASRRLADRLAVDQAAWDAPSETASSVETVFPIQMEALRAAAAPGAPLTPPVTLTLQPGSIVELTGPSGVGKTTLAETLMRLHPPASGQLTYSGQPAESLRIASVLKHIAISPQLPAFLPGTVADQLRLAKPNATEAEMRAALDRALASDFIFARASGLETLIGETGPGFSGGELRRLGLARALIAGPELLILDEPFAGLDAALVTTLRKNLSDWVNQGGRALLVLQHHPSAHAWPSEGPNRLPVTHSALA